MSASTAVTLEDTPSNEDPSTREAQVASLTGLRGLAALMVVLVHLGYASGYAWLGIPSYGPVSLFVLSGYLLYRPWSRWILRAAARPSVPTFARRRVARIFPAYLLVLFVVAGVYPAARPGSAEGWFQAITLTWIYDSHYFPTALAQTWSLATELSWYVALPIMAGVTGLVARSRSPKQGFWISTAMIGLGLPVSVAWRWWVSAQDLDPGVSYMLWLPGFLGCFAFGALVAHFAEGLRLNLVQLTSARSLIEDPWALPVFALAMALLGTSLLGGPPGFPETAGQEQVRVWCATMVAGALLVMVVLGRREAPLSRLLGLSWMTAVGRWSYGIYLWHLPVIVMSDEQITFPDGAAGFVFELVWVLAISIPLGAATYAWVERPAIAWSRRPGAASATSGQRVRRADRPRDTPEPAAASSTTSAQATAAPPTEPPRF